MYGWIKLDRDILNWRWFKNANVYRVFTYLILTANYEAHDFENLTIGRGQAVTSYPKISNALGITEAQARTAISNLKKTGEITVNATPKFSVITIINYDMYQCADRQNNSQTADKQQTDNSQMTAIKEYKEINKEKNKEDERLPAFEKTSQKSWRHKYGEYNHVLLTDEQLKKLNEDFGDNTVAVYIRKVDEYCQQTGKTYKDYNLTIRNWIGKDGNFNGTCNARNAVREEEHSKYSREF